MEYICIRRLIHDANNQLTIVAATTELKGDDVSLTAARKLNCIIKRLTEIVSQKKDTDHVR